jgi:hypothetical protein
VFQSETGEHVFHLEQEIETVKDETTNNPSSETTATPPPPASEAVPDGKLPPELLAWALQHIDEEEIRAGLEEIRKTGGLQLSDFIHELEQLAATHD